MDISSFQVLTPDMESSLNDFSNSGIDGIDFAAINTSVGFSFCRIIKKREYLTCQGADILSALLINVFFQYYICYLVEKSSLFTSFNSTVGR